MFVQLNDTEYDITNFIHRHPGGNVITYAIGAGNVEQMFRQFHGKNAYMILKTLPKRKAPVEDDEMLKDFDQLEKDLRDEGYFDVSYIHGVYRLLELVCIFIFGLFLFKNGNIISGVLVHGLFGGRCGWVHHELNHGSMVFGFLRSFIIGFGLLLSADMWRMMHNKHHVATQKVGHDLDIDTLPFVAFFRDAVKKTRRSFLFLPRLQALTFVPFTSGLLIMSFWVYFLHWRRILTKRLWKEALCILSGHILRTYAYMYFTGSDSIMISYLIGVYTCQWVSYMYLFGHFSLSHTFMEIVDENEHKTWPKYALEHTTNVSPDNVLVSWIMGYLNCQIEHHLWPRMPQHRQPEVSRRVRAFCDKHGIKYNSVSYFEAWRMMFRNLWDVGNDIASRPKTE